MNKMLWIDDVRVSPDGYDQAWSSMEAIDMLSIQIRAGTPYDHISFDHDLGGDDTTRKVVMWMIENDHPPINWTVHSANPVGKEWLSGTLSRYLSD